MDQELPPQPSDDDFLSPAYVTSPHDVDVHHNRSFSSMPGAVSSGLPASSHMQHRDTKQAENPAELSTTYGHNASSDDFGPHQPANPDEFSTTPQFQDGHIVPCDDFNSSVDQLARKDARHLENDSESRRPGQRSPEMVGNDRYYPSQGHDDIAVNPLHSHHQNARNEASVDDSFDSVILDDRDPGIYPQPPAVGRLKGLENEAYSYDGDAETDLSHSFQGWPVEPPVLRNPDPFPILESDRPSSGRYQKNPILERSKPPVAQGPYDPNIGVFLAPPLATTKKTSGEIESQGVRRRIPRPPNKLAMKCAFAWSCLACLIGSFLCAIPAIRYAVTASESRKIGDFNSANSYLKKTAILTAVALVLGVGAWTVVILHLSGSL